MSADKQHVERSNKAGNIFNVATKENSKTKNIATQFVNKNKQQHPRNIKTRKKREGGWYMNAKNQTNQKNSPETVSLMSV